MITLKARLMEYFDAHWLERIKQADDAARGDLLVKAWDDCLDGFYSEHCENYSFLDASLACHALDLRVYDLCEEYHLDFMKLFYETGRIYE